MRWPTTCRIIRSCRSASRSARARRSCMRSATRRPRSASSPIRSPASRTEAVPRGLADRCRAGRASARVAREGRVRLDRRCRLHRPHRRQRAAGASRRPGARARQADPLSRAAEELRCDLPRDRERRGHRHRVAPCGRARDADDGRAARRAVRCVEPSSAEAVRAVVRCAAEVRGSSSRSCPAKPRRGDARRIRLIRRYTEARP